MEHRTACPGNAALLGGSRFPLYPYLDRWICTGHFGVVLTAVTSARRHLQQWAFGIGATPGGIYDFLGRQQRRYLQWNGSGERAMPIETLAREVDMKRTALRRGELWRRGSSQAR